MFRESSLPTMDDFCEVASFTAQTDHTKKAGQSPLRPPLPPSYGGNTTLPAQDKNKRLPEFSTLPTSFQNISAGGVLGDNVAIIA